MYVVEWLNNKLKEKQTNKKTENKNNKPGYKIEIYL